MARLFKDVAAGIVGNARILPRKWVPGFWKYGCQHFSSELNLCCGFTGNRLGGNVRIDRGIISGFHNKSGLDMRFTGHSLCFPENHGFHVLSLNNLCLFGGQIWKAFIFVELKI